MPSLPSLDLGWMTYRIRELHFLLCAVFWCKQVPDGEEEEKQLNRAANGVVLVTRLDVANGNGGTRNALEMRICIGQEACSRILYFMKIHPERLCRECGDELGQ